MNWSSFFLANKIKSNLIGGEVLSLMPYGYRVSGKIDAPATLAKIRVYLAQDFDAVLAWPPSVLCLEPWMRSDINWHNSKTKGMCWVLSSEWRDVLSNRNRDESEIIHVACNWLIHNATSLISRHFYGYTKQLKEWPAEWDEWRHDALGTQQYQNENSLDATRHN